MARPLRFGVRTPDLRDVPAVGLAKWGGANWSDVGGFSGVASSLAVDGTNLYVGGTFTNCGGISITNIAKWNGANWSALGDGIGYYEPTLSQLVNVLLWHNGQLYAGGAFTNAGAVGHDFKIHGRKTRVLTHGQSETLRVTFLRKGHYTYQCTVPGHAAAGDFRDGWHYPGELAALDPSGYLHLHGRTSEVIFRGGAKIFPTEVEAVLQAHESVAEAAVVARASSGNEQELVAYVIAAAPVASGQLLAHCRRRLTPYKVPREIHIVSELPRNAAGKLDKRALTGQPAASLSTKV